MTNIKINRTKLVLCIALALLLVANVVALVLLSVNPAQARAESVIEYYYDAMGSIDEGNRNTFDGPCYEGMEGSVIEYWLPPGQDFGYGEDQGSEDIVNVQFGFYLEGMELEDDPMFDGQGNGVIIFQWNNLVYSGWSAFIDLSNFYNGGYIKAGETKTLYMYGAIWNDDRGQWGSVMNTSALGEVSVVEIEQKPLPITPTKTGYTFTGWYTDKACTQLYTQDYIYEGTTLYAGWRANTYSIEFNGNGHTSGSTDSVVMTYDVAENLPQNGFKRSGYKFDGWATSSTGAVVYTDGQSVKNLTSTNEGIVKLYAHWTLVDYTVAFNSNGGVGTMASETHVRDVSKTLKSNTFTKTGYTFKGWATTPTGTVAYANGQSVTNIGTAGSTVTLYAVWQSNTYTVTFNSNGGTGSMSQVTMTFDSPTVLPENLFQREGYNFKGWTTKAGGTDVEYRNCEEVENLTTTANGNVTLYAVWEIKLCKVTFIVDGEVWHIEVVEYGTLASEVIGSAVDSTFYEVEGELPNA